MATYKPLIDTDETPIFLIISASGDGKWEGSAWQADTSLKGIAVDFATGGSDGVVQVVEIRSGRATDVTQQVADLIMGRPADEIGEEAGPFLERCGHDLQAAQEAYENQPSDWDEHALGTHNAL
jgi:hypothetical protein